MKLILNLSRNFTLLALLAVAGLLCWYICRYPSPPPQHVNAISTPQGTGLTPFTTSGSGWFNVVTITTTCRNFTIINNSSQKIYWGWDNGLPGSVAPVGQPIALPAGSSYTPIEAFGLSAGQSIYVQRTGSVDAGPIDISAY